MDLILTFAKPKRARPIEEWKDSYPADGAPPGCYTPNMSKADKESWKAKVVGSQSGNHQIEIRKTVQGTNVVIVVNGSMPEIVEPKNRWERRRREPTSNVRISANGPMQFSPKDWAELNRAVNEAHAVLTLLDHADTKKAALKASRAGAHPLAKP